MPEYIGVLATTSVLPNGFAFSHQELVKLSEQINTKIVAGKELTLNEEHRTDLSAKGRIAAAWVDTHKSDPSKYALYARLETKNPLPDGQGLSIAVFGLGISISDADEHLLTIGVPPQHLVRRDVVTTLEEIAQLLGTRDICLRLYIAHDFASLSQGAIVLILGSAATGIIGGLSYDLVKNLVKKFKGIVEQYGDNKANRVQITAETERGRVEVFIPTSIGPELIEKVILRSIEAIDEHGKVTTRNFNLGIQVDEKGDLHKSEID